MPRHATPCTPPTDEQLRLAYRQLSRPHTWPPTVEAALAHPVYGKCLCALARQLNRPGAHVHNGSPQHLAHRLPQGPAVPPVQPAPVRRHKATDEGVNLWTRRRGIDLKRAAANDLED